MPEHLTTDCHCEECEYLRNRAVKFPPTLAEIQQKREYATCHRLIEALASMCVGSDKVIIEKLTGYLWDEEEAEKIKAA
jgi:hypothetical protein